MGARQPPTFFTIFSHCVPLPAAGAPAIITFSGWLLVCAAAACSLSVATCALHACALEDSQNAPFVCLEQLTF